MIQKVLRQILEKRLSKLSYIACFTVSESTGGAAKEMLRSSWLNSLLDFPHTPPEDILNGNNKQLREEKGPPRTRNQLKICT